MPVTAAPRPAQASPRERLRALPILAEAAPEALDRAAAAAAWRTFEAGELILDMEDPAREVLFVLEGRVRVLVRTPAGRELILSELEPGALFGEIAAIDGAGRTAVVCAVQRSRLCAIPGPVFLDAACSTPAASLALLRWVTATLRRQSSRSLEREALPVKLRLCAELLRLSRPRGEDAIQRIVTPPPTHQLLAARIGSRREVVSREMSELARGGLLEKARGGLVLPRPAALREMLDAELKAESPI